MPPRQPTVRKPNTVKSFLDLVLAHSRRFIPIVCRPPRQPHLESLVLLLPFLNHFFADIIGITQRCVPSGFAVRATSSARTPCAITVVWTRTVTGVACNGLLDYSLFDLLVSQGRFGRRQKRKQCCAAQQNQMFHHVEFSLV